METLDICAEELQRLIRDDFCGIQYRHDLLVDLLLCCNGQNVDRAITSCVQMFEPNIPSLGLFVEIVNDYVNAEGLQ